ncbi:hypothetical protein FACS1894216_04150 [Synergistales bacterium]|nr:hypothetical protein FACS1894216_04150 [Synergistales bacterium]
MPTVKEICEALSAEVHVEGNSSRAVENATAGDLLSFVMGSDADGAAWVTIQTHVNVAAVAVLKDTPIIIIADRRAPMTDLTERCGIEGIALATAPESIFETCAALSRLGLKG